MPLKKYVINPATMKDEEYVESTEQHRFILDTRVKYNETLRELLSVECKRVEYLRGVLSVYKDIIDNYGHWYKERHNPF